MNCQVKSKYLNRWQEANIDLDVQKKSFILKRGEIIKYLQINNITKYQTHNDKQQGFLLKILFNEREYQIKGDENKLKKIINILDYWRKIINYKQIQQQPLCIPKFVDYSKFRKVQIKNVIQDKSQMSSHQQQIIQQFYLKQDWRRDSSNCGLVFINQSKKGKIPQLVKFVLKKFLSTGSFMGISFPAFAMKPQSILQTYCKCFNLAPKLLNGLKNPVQRMKMLNCLVLTFSLRFTDLDKSFNPTIGETYQAMMDGSQFYAQQISHHPPISAILIKSKDFQLSGNFQLQANISLNKAKGFFIGHLVVQYKDGARLVARIPSGVVHGVLFGETYFCPSGSSYTYDLLNEIFCCTTVQQQCVDTIRGIIGKLNFQTWKQFLQLIQKNDKKSIQLKFHDFQQIPQKKFQRVYSRMEAIWSKQISFDGKIYIDYDQDTFKPIKFYKKLPKNLLLSDSRFRKDIPYRKIMRIQQAQRQKQDLQNQQRRLRKLRQQHKNIK